METYDRAWVERHVAQTAELWGACAAGPDRNARRYTQAEQDQRERAYDIALQSAEGELESPAETKAERSSIRRRILASFGTFSAEALDLQGEAVELLTREFLPVGAGLAKWAREFDPSLAMPDIIQAARNAWTACGLQPLLGAPVELTPSILGYSLLYPYSDNYLDDEKITAEMKLAFSCRFGSRLLGEQLPPADHRERAMWALIGLIEEQYPRAYYPQVFESLLAIHSAQEQSVAQLHSGRNGSDGDYLRLSCRKGGSSVLADACLAYGSLKPEESRFAFEWGVLLQLGDDLQDVRDDLRRGSATLFSQAAAAGGTLDELTVQLLGFCEKVAHRMSELPQGSSTLKELLMMSWRSLIIRAVADSHEFFSSRFLREAERYSPFRFEFLRARANRLTDRQGLYAKLFEALLDSDEDNQFNKTTRQQNAISSLTSEGRLGLEQARIIRE